MIIFSTLARYISLRFLTAIVGIFVLCLVLIFLVKVTVGINHLNFFAIQILCNFVSLEAGSRDFFLGHVPLLALFEPKLYVLVNLRVSVA